MAAIRLSRPVVAAAVAILALLPLAADAGAKVTCEQRGEHREDIELGGLPARPVAGASYELTITTKDVDASSKAPRLMVMNCDAMGPNEHGLAPWTRADATSDAGIFQLDVRFPEPGTYAMSVIENGLFHDAGLHRVVAADPATDEAASASTREPSGPVLIGSAVALVIGVAGAGVAARRRARA